MVPKALSHAGAGAAILWSLGQGSWDKVMAANRTADLSD